MIGFRTAAGWLDLSPGTIGLEISNPFFRYDAVPGVTSYPFGLPMTPGNLRRLNFPHVRAEQGETPAPEPVECYLDHQLWRIGSLIYEEHQPEKRVLQYKFVAAADDLAARIEGLKLAELDLGQVPLVVTHDHPDYALGMLKNPGFYGDKQVGYLGLLNAHIGGNYVGTFLSPQLRLVPLLRRVLAHVGFDVEGAWLSEPDVEQLVVYSDRVAEDAAGSVATHVVFNQYVPTGLTVAQLLVALQKLFALGYDFDPVRRILRITRLREVALDDAYLVRAAGAVTRAIGPKYEGYLLRMGLEDGEQNKQFDTSWRELRIDGGKTELATDAGTLLTVLDAGLERLLPLVDAKGASPAHELGNDSRCGLRLLFDRGLQPAAGGAYPLVTSGHVNTAGQAVGELALQWAGPQGLYAQCHQPWLDLLARAGVEERTQPFRIGDLLTLSPARKELVGPRKYLWEKISLSIHTARRLESARFTYRPVRR
ncbi:hypothetical protein [Hymenobacter sp. B81]|uniref:hypothetical protein n=1 Tax=Hymenobacter sp. B81 TaxID=3344878 RepID=UPI0037DD7F9E